MRDSQFCEWIYMIACFQRSFETSKPCSVLFVNWPLGWPPDEKNWLIWKDPDSGKDWRQEVKGPTEDEMVGWHNWLDEHESEQAPGVGDGQGGLACCSPWGCRVGHDWAIELNWKVKRMEQRALCCGYFYLERIIYSIWGFCYY